MEKKERLKDVTYHSVLSTEMHVNKLAVVKMHLVLLTSKVDNIRLIKIHTHTHTITYTFCVHLVKYIFVSVFLQA